MNYAFSSDDMEIKWRKPLRLGGPIGTRTFYLKDLVDKVDTLSARINEQEEEIQRLKYQLDHL